MNIIANYIHKLPEGVKSGAVYTVSMLVTKGLAFITIPIFTRLMSTDEIGNVNLYNSWFSMISIISTLSLTSGGYQLALKKYSNNKDEYSSSVLSITSLMALFIVAVYLLFSNIINKIIGLPHSLMILLLIGIFVSPAQDFWMSRQRFEYKYRLAGFISICSAALASVASVLLVIYQNSRGGATAEGRLFANNLVIYGVSFAFWVYIIFKGKKLYKKEYWTFSLSLSIPLVGHALAKQLLDVSDRFMINYYVGKSAVGIYGTIYTVSSISLIVWNALNSAYIPYLFNNIDSPENKKNIQKSSILLLLSYSGIAILMTYLAPEIIKILATDEYYESIYIMPPIAMGVSLTAISNMYSNVLVYYKKTKIIMYASCTAAISNIMLNMLFIPTFGYQAAAYTTLVSYVILVIVEGVAGTRTYKKVTGESEMIYSNKFITSMTIIMMVLNLAGLFVYSSTLIRLLLVAGIALTVIYLFHKIAKI